MRRIGGLMERIAEPENLRLAFWKAARHKRQRVDCQTFAARLDTELLDMREGLLSGTIPVGNHRFFTIHDPKERRICAACFRERVLHHAIVNVCEPVLERGQIFDSYACRKGKGRTAAIRRAAGWARRNPWFLKMDVRRYYDSVVHATLLDMLDRLFKDRALMELFRRILAVYETEPGRGLPIGHLTSQHFGNLYLTGFDRWIKETKRFPCYIRYMDDLAIWDGGKDELNALRLEVEAFWMERLGLSLNPRWQINRCAHGCEYLGYVLFPDRVRLNRRSRLRFKRKMRHFDQAMDAGDYDEADWVRHVEPVFAFVREADTLGLRRQVVGAGMRTQARTA